MGTLLNLMRRNEILPHYSLSWTLTKGLLFYIYIYILYFNKKLKFVSLKKGMSPHKMYASLVFKYSNVVILI